MLSRRILIFIVMVFANSSFASSDDCIKSMAWNDDYPYTFKSDKTSRLPQGMNIDVVSTVLTKWAVT